MHHRLADQHAAGPFEPGDGRRILAGYEVREYFRTTRGRDPFRPKAVLDRHRHARQRQVFPVPGGNLLVDIRCRVKCLVASHRDEGMERRVEVRNAFQGQLGHSDSGQFPPANRLRNRSGRLRREVDHAGHSSTSMLTSGSAPARSRGEI